MKPKYKVIFAFFLMVSFCGVWAGEISLPKVQYGIGNWDKEKYGNHRAVVFVAGKPDAASVVIPWRRRDEYPERKRIIVISEQSGQKIGNVKIVTINSDYGEIILQPDRPNGYYYIYYMPYEYEKPLYCPSTLYLSPKETADAQWIQANQLENPTRDKSGSLQTGIVERIEAVDEFHSFYPMEVPAMKDETARLAKRYRDDPFLIFCEDRKHSIRMEESIPLKWYESGPVTRHEGRAMKDEYYVFQVGIFAHQDDVDNIKVRFHDLLLEESRIKADSFTCFNTGGIDVQGEPFEKVVNVSKGTVQPLWIGLQIPKDARTGEYRGTLKIFADDIASQPVEVVIHVTGDAIRNHGDDDLWRMSKLRWLNSTIGQGDNVILALDPIKVNDRTVEILGRKIRISDTGLPSRIDSYFADTLDELQDDPVEILSSPIEFSVIEDGQIHLSRLDYVSLEKVGKMYAAFRGSRESRNVSREIEVTVENDGWVDCRVILTAVNDASIDDAVLTIPFRRDVAKYMMGMGFRGGKRPGQWSWAWPNGQFNHMLWVGDVNAGMRLRLDYPFEYWSLNSYAPSGRPDAWYNNGQGKCELFETRDSFVCQVKTGNRSLKKGDRLVFRFSLLVTPFKPIDYDHWNWRYCHGWKDLWPVDKVLENGAKIVNVHQGNRVIPNINYPFTTADKIQNYIANAKKAGLDRVKIYYTVRELTNRLPELWAFRSLGDEIYLHGSGFQLADHFSPDSGNSPAHRSGGSWLCEHLIDKYAPAWHDQLDGKWDAAIATQGISRLHNFYLEGLSWLIKNADVSGLYLDGIGYDRRTTRRLRVVLDQAKEGCLLDFHSGDNFHGNYGKSNPANLYMEHFPYLDSLWFGEGYDYGSNPDYWLVEISGLPFGLFGEMLQGGGNPWRGMIYGMSNRLRWQGNPKPIWALWDLFGIEDSRMFGYWSEKSPVKTHSDEVLATVYQKKDSALIVLASWAKSVKRITLDIDWEKLGFDPDNCILYAPDVEKMQEEKWFTPDGSIPVVPEQGWFFILRAKRAGEVVSEPEDSAEKDWYARLELKMEDLFSGPSLEDWQVHKSADLDADIGVYKDQLRISAPANAYAYLSAPLPENTWIVECQISRGTDMGASWGPGIAVAWPEGDLRLHLRSDGRFCIDDGRSFDFCGMVSTDGNYVYHVRLVFEGRTLLFQYSLDGAYYITLREVDIPYPGLPKEVMIGKMGIPDRDMDYDEPGAEGVCRLDDFKVYAAQ